MKSFFLFFEIGEFEVKGDTDYKLSELVSASGLRTGDRFYEVNEKEAEELKRLIDEHREG